MKNKILSLIMAALLIFTASVPSYAYAYEYDNLSEGIMISDYMTRDEVEFMKKLEPIYQYFEINDGKLFLNVDENILVDEYDFTQSDLLRLEKMYSFAEENIISNNDVIESINNLSLTDGTNLNGTKITPMVHVSNWKIYFTYDDVMGSLFAAAQIGPAAIIAALSAVGSAVPGAGTVVGAVIGLIGASTIIYFVFQAAALEKGLYIGIDWNGPFPNPAIGLW